MSDAATVETLPPREMKATRREMMKAGVPLQWRDYCAHLLIPLNKCRVNSFYMPFRCTDERHAYEQCQYKDFLYRKQMKDLQLKAKQQAKEEAEE